MAQDVIVRGVTYSGVEKLSLPVSGGSVLFRDTSDADATSGDVLSGKKAYNANGEINGGMTNQGAVSGTISDKDTPFQIPQGYHNGSGSVEIAAAQKALLVPGNIRDSVTILGVTGNYTGGGGGPTSADALLIVTAPAGSTVTATKGGTTLSPTMWTTSADANLECALFVIGSSLFDAQNAWTVTATSGLDTASDTVVIDGNKSYEVYLSFSLVLYRAGQTSGWTAAGWAAVSGQTALAPSINYYSDEMIITEEATAGGRTGVAYYTNKVDLTRYRTIACSGSFTGATYSSSAYNGLYIWSAINSGYFYNGTAMVKREIVSEGTISISMDVTTLSGEYYVGFGLRRHTNNPHFNIASLKCNP